MYRIVSLTSVMLIAISTQAFAAPARTEDVTFTSGNETIKGYLALPQAPGKYPALVVIHEDWGLTDWIKGQTRKLAEHGYVALAVDLYRGQVAYDPQLAYELMAGTPTDRALGDLEAAIHFLYVRPDVIKEKMGAIGWSMGGKLSLLLAVNDPFLAACVSNYGSLPLDSAGIERIHAAVLAIFGADDRYLPASDVEAFAAAMNKAHKSVDIKVYPHAAGGFENPDNKLGYREGAADDAWRRTMEFLDQHLK